LFFDGLDFAGDSVELEHGSKYEILGWSDDLEAATKATSDKEFVWYPVQLLADVLRSAGCESGRALLLKKID